MNIGFDGKRAFQNKTGLGSYSRVLLDNLCRYYPQHHYTLFAPKSTDLFNAESYKNISVITPKTYVDKRLAALWRRRRIIKDIPASGIDLYHGVSNELPSGLKKSSIKKIVTIHDLIFERFPDTYSPDERYVHRWKIKHACHVADVIIAISKQTKDDLINLFRVPPEKIEVCYQSCSPAFYIQQNEDEKRFVKEKYNLPTNYLLFVGSVSKRKNLITVCKAMNILKEKLNIPLVVIGNGKKQKDEAKEFMADNGITDRLIILNELPQSKEKAFINGEDFPAIYQQATALIYPSIFEGFGIPLLEAFASAIPVICSNISSLPEVGGEAAFYFEPLNAEQLAEKMYQVATDSDLSKQLINKGFERLELFSGKNHAESIMDVYSKIQ